MRKAKRIDDAVQALAALLKDDPEIDSIPSLRDLRTALADRIEADIALLDALDGDPDVEDGHDAEDTDDNGVADDGGLAWVRGGTTDAEDFSHEAVEARR